MAPTMDLSKADFSGWATRNNLKCADGRTIMADAFKHQDQMIVPLVWSHKHDDPSLVLGHALLQNRKEGVFTYGFFNESAAGQNSKELVQHGDINSLSIFANHLVQEGKNVKHGDIKEVSLVLAGANPGAFITNVNLEHSDSDEKLSEALIFTGFELSLSHSDEEDEEEDDETEENEEDDETEEDDENIDVQETLESLDEDQQAVVHSLLSDALSNEHTLEASEVQELFESMSEEQQVVVHSLVGEALAHADNKQGAPVAPTATSDKTVADVFDTLSEEQKNVVYFMIGQALDEAAAKNNVQHSDLDPEVLKHAIQEGFESMTHNLFESQGKTATEAPTLSHDDLKTIVDNAQKLGSFKEAVLAHAGTYGIDDIDVLFPDAQTVTSSPEVIGRRTEWVQTVLAGSKHSPFARVKSTAVDVTAEEARAKGYVKGNLKKDEVIKLLKRVTLPTTVYKKQKLDRDDIVDITDLDVVSWLKAEMRVMLDEEIARAILIGDGREPDDADKVNEDNLRPIAWDDDMYAHQVTVPSNVAGDALVESILRARKFYKGTGTPTLFTTDDILTDLILLKDKVGRRLYNTEAELAAALRVDKVVVVEVMESVPDVLAIIVNMADYTIGADRGGQVSMFDDFDIDYNQQKYLIESRISGCLTKPKSAVVVKRTSGTTVTPTAPAFNAATNTITVPAITGVEYYDVTSTTGSGVLLTAGDHVITETTDVEARPVAGYNFPHNTDTDWVYAYTA